LEKEKVRVCERRLESCDAGPPIVNGREAASDWTYPEFWEKKEEKKVEKSRKTGNAGGSGKGNAR